MTADSAKKRRPAAKKRTVDAEKLPVGGLVTGSVHARLSALNVDPTENPQAALAVTLAMQMDAGAGLAAAGIAKQIDALMTALQPAEGDDEELLELRPPVVNPPKRPSNPRR